MAQTKNFHVPEEILSQIIQNFNPHELLDLRTLAHFSQISKLLHRLVEPILYARFPGQRSVNPRLWLEGVLARSGREELVEEVCVDEFVRWREDVEEEDEELEEEGAEEEVAEEEVAEEEVAEEEVAEEEVAEEEEAEDDEADGSDGGSSEEEDEEEEEDLESLTPREIDILSEDACFGKLNPLHVPTLQDLIQNAKLKPRTRQKLLKALESETQRQEENTSTDLIMSLIVLLCPHIHTISISVPDCFDQALLPLALTARNGQIETINLNRSGKRDTRGEGAVETLARLNVLERRKVENLNATNDDLGYIMDPGNEEIFGPWPCLTHISLKCCVVPVPALVILTSGSPALTSLELVLDPKPLDAMSDILRAHCPVLEHFSYNVNDEKIFFEDEILEYEAQRGLYGLGDLTSLIHLRELEVPVWALLSWSGLRRGETGLGIRKNLPKGLENFRVLDSQWEVSGLEREVREMREGGLVVEAG